MNIFDSLAHPTIDGSWVSKNLDASFESLQKLMYKSNIKWALAVGLNEIGNYTHEEFLKQCQLYKNLFPIAGFDPTNIINIDEEILRLKTMGFYGIKIHPRFSKLSLDDDKMNATFHACAKANMPLLLCTYFYDRASCMQNNTFDNLLKLLKRQPDTRVILVHGGAVELLKYMELVRFNQNLLLDLSLTIMKYEGSSIDLDIRFMFHHFDRRICIGTDHPEYSPAALEHRFSFFSKGLSEEKKQNIAYANIANFLGIKL